MCSSVGSGAVEKYLFSLKRVSARLSIEKFAGPALIESLRSRPHANEIDRKMYQKYVPRK
jgi:hypothetical protein